MRREPERGDLAPHHLCEVARLQRELDGSRARIAEGAQASNEVSQLREERELVRNRVVQMIAQIDKLNL